MADRDMFGPRLRAERERRGITLKNIAESTKIKESLFVELERNDLSNWPQGIFRRAHLCAYASAIGLPTQPILAEYLRLFPEDCPVNQSDDVEVNGATGGHHAEQTLKPSRFAPPIVDRTWVVFFDLAAVCLMSSILAAIVGMNPWPAIAFVGLAYAAVGSACFEQSIGTYVQHRINRPQTPLRRHSAKFKSSLPNERAVPSQGDMNREPEVEGRRASA